MNGPSPADRTAAPSGPAVAAAGLEVGYGAAPVWKDATFSVGAGEFVAVIGPNGAGKTTLFRLLLGLLAPRAGTLEVLGGAPARGDARIGYVPQRHAIDYATNVRSYELVRLGYAGHKWGFPRSGRAERAAAGRALAAVGSTELADRPLGALSGGELQRIFLAEALVADPRLLLLDEPLSNLDVRRARDLVALVHRVVRSRGVAALLVAHDINPLIRYLDQVIYVANGRVASGPPDEVLTTRRLSALYGVPVEVLHDSHGRIVIVGGEEHTEGEAVGGEGHHEGEASGGAYPIPGSGR